MKRKVLIWVTLAGLGALTLTLIILQWRSRTLINWYGQVYAIYRRYVNEQDATLAKDLQVIHDRIDQDAQAIDIAGTRPMSDILKDCQRRGSD